MPKEKQTVKVSQKYQISIPSSVRRKLDIVPGDRLTVHVRDDHLVLMRLPRSPEEWEAKFMGLHKEIWDGIDATEYVRRERGNYDE